MGNRTNNEFDFFHGREADQYSFYRIPKLLFTDKRFSKVSLEAKLLYGLLLDRMSLSTKNGWIDKDDRVYIYFKLEDAMEFMGIGKDKGVKLFAELDSEKGCGLIQKKRQGLGKPTIIYVMNFNSGRDETDTETGECDNSLTSEIPKSGHLDCAEVLTSEKPKSGLLEMPKSEVLENRNLDFCKTDSNYTEINNNKYNNTEFSDTYPIKSNPSSHIRAKQDVNDAMRERQQYRTTICFNIEYDSLLRNYSEDMVDGVVEIMVDAICSKRDYLIINGDEVPQAAVKCRFLKLDYGHIEYVLDCLKKNTTKVKNIKSYLLTSLYNSLATIGHYYTAEVNHDFYGVREENM